jgi:hypothetical protein
VPVEKFYTVQELAAELNWSDNTIRKLFSDEPGVLALEGAGKYSGKRHYATYRIPESAKLRVLERLRKKPLKVKLAPLGPRRVVFLRDRDRRVA